MKNFPILFVFEDFFSLLLSSTRSLLMEMNGEGQNGEKLSISANFCIWVVFSVTGNTLFSFISSTFKKLQRMITQWNFYGFRMFVMFVPLNSSQLLEIIYEWAWHTTMVALRRCTRTIRLWILSLYRTEFKLSRP